MSHPVLELQTALLAAFAADTALQTLLGGNLIFDAPPRGASPPYAVITRHDVLARDGDETPGHDHRLLIQCWHPSPNRKAVLQIAERIVAVVLQPVAGTPALAITHAQHDRTDTAVDTETGHARAAIVLRVFSEPA